MDDEEEIPQTEEVDTSQQQPVQTEEPMPAGPTPPPGLAVNAAPMSFGPTPPGTARAWSTANPQVQTFTAPQVDPRAEAIRVQNAQNAQLWNTLRSRTANMPIAQTEQAVAAALRFQGQRQYQRDLASGMAPGEALARSAPLIFGAPRQGNLGQAASFLRATTPRAPSPPRFSDVGGVLYRHNPDGTVTAVTPPKAPPAPKVSPFDTEEYRSVLGEIAGINKQLAEPNVPTAEADEMRNHSRFLQSRLADIRKRSQASTPTGGTSTRRIRVRAPSGKFGSIPESQLEAAKAAGYTQVQ